MRKLKTVGKTDCKQCGSLLTKKTWAHWRKRIRHLLCNSCALKRQNERYKIFGKEICAKRKAFRLQEKIKFVNAYGGKCTCCGEKEIQFLTIEHIAKDGAKHRKQIGGSSRQHQWIRKNGYPKDFTVLCFNCNAASFYYGRCPHKIGKQIMKFDKEKML